MKRVFLSMILATAVLALAAGRAAAQNPGCVTGTSGDLICVDSNDAAAGSGNPLAPVTAMLPAQGILAVGPKGGIDPNQLYVFFDGDETNPDPLDGYLGINMHDMNKSLLGLVYAASGNFNRAGGNMPLLPGGLPPLPAPPGVPDLPTGTLPPLPMLAGVGLPPLGSPPTLPALPSAPDLGGVPNLPTLGDLTGPLMSTLANAGK